MMSVPVAFKPTVTVALVFAAVLTFSGCGSTANSELVVDDMPLTDALNRGKTIYDANCHSCHLQGQGGVGPALNNKPLPIFLIKLQVRNGLGVMPAFSEEQISDQELEDLANYVVALRQHMR